MDVTAKRPTITKKPNRACKFEIKTGAGTDSLLKRNENATSVISKYHNVRQRMRKYVNDVIHDATLSLYVVKTFPRAVSIDASSSKDLQSKIMEVAAKGQGNKQPPPEFIWRRASQTSAEDAAEEEFKRKPQVQSENAVPIDQNHKNFIGTHKSVSDTGSVVHAPKRSINTEDFRNAGKKDINSDSFNDAPEFATKVKKQEEAPSNIGDRKNKPESQRHNLDVPESRNPSPMISQEIFKNAAEVRSQHEDFPSVIKTISSKENTDRNEPQDKGGAYVPKEQAGGNKQDNTQPKRPLTCKEQRLAGMPQQVNANDDSPGAKADYTGKMNESKGTPQLSTDSPLSKERRNKPETAVNNPYHKNVKGNAPIINHPSHGNQVDKKTQTSSNYHKRNPSQDKSGTTVNFPNQGNMKQGIHEPSPRYTTSIPIHPTGGDTNILQNQHSSQEVVNKNDSPESTQPSPRPQQVNKKEDTSTLTSNPHQTNVKKDNIPATSSFETPSINNADSQKTITKEALDKLQDNIQRISELVNSIDEETLRNNPELVTELANLLYVQSNVLQSAGHMQDATNTTDGGPSTTGNINHNRHKDGIDNNSQNPGPSSRGKKNKLMNNNIDSTRHRSGDCAHCKVKCLGPEARLPFQYLQKLHRSPTVFKSGNRKFYVVHSMVGRMLDRYCPVSSSTNTTKTARSSHVFTKKYVTRKMSLIKASREFLKRGRHHRNSV